LFCFSVAEEFLAKVARDLQAADPNVELSGLALSRYEYRNVLKSSARWKHVSVVSDALREHTPAKADVRYLREIERKYGDPNLYMIAAGDWYVKDYRHEQMLRVLEGTFRHLEVLWERVKPDAIVAEGIDCVSSYALYTMAKHHGVPFLWPATRTPNRVAFVGNPEERWERMEEILESLQDSPLDPDRRAKAQSYVTAFKTEGHRPTYVQAIRMPSLGLHSLQLFLDTMRINRADSGSYHTIPMWKLPFRRLRRMARRAVADALFFDRPDPRDEFVLFGLHYQPEASTLVWAPYYVDQASLAERIAKSLPVGHWLYVKEHPFAVGRRPLSEYQRLRRIPQVKLIAPYVDSHTLIPKAACVATITGTLGWEAMLYERPVVTFGRGFCRTSGLLHLVHEIEELPALLREAIYSWRPDREQLLKVVTAAMEGSHVGDIGYRDGVAQARSDPNALLVAQALSKELKIHLGRQTPRYRAGPEVGEDAATITK